MTNHSLRNILSKVNTIQNQLALPEIRKASRSAEAFLEHKDKLLQQTTYLAKGIDRNLAERDLTGADLAIRSRRGYQWLKFLSRPSSLNAHLDLLQRVNLFLEHRKGIAAGKIAFKLYHQSPLYKVSHNGRVRQIVVQESFLSAPDTIIKALLEISQDPSSPGARSALREYSFSKEYRVPREELEYLGIPPGKLAAGQTRNLEDSFQRVNQEYFEGGLAQPHLVWNNRLTHRKFGHYQWDTDTIMVSSSLDQQHIPTLVVDFVIYHELLHKKLGARLAKQNRIAHSREFRDLENQFRNSSKARQLLNKLARKGR